MKIRNLVRLTYLIELWVGSLAFGPTSFVTLYNPSKPIRNDFHSISLKRLQKKCRSRATINVSNASSGPKEADTVHNVASDDKGNKWRERAKRWIVLVDDDESIRRAVGQFLYDQGYQVTACADADSLMEVLVKQIGTPTPIKRTIIARESIGSPRPDDFGDTSGTDVIQLPAIPDVIICDIRMPQSSKDGIQITELLRSSDRLKRVPIVLLTAKSFTQDRIEGYKAGADVYLTKPFDPQELLSIIDNTIQRRHQMAGQSGKIVDVANDINDIKALLEKQTGDIYLKPSQRSSVHLTPKEIQVLTLLSEGYTNSEIAAIRQNKTTQSVNRTIQTLYRKTSTNNRTELVRWAIRSGNVRKPS